MRTAIHIHHEPERVAMIYPNLNQMRVYTSMTLTGRLICSEDDDLGARFSVQIEHGHASISWTRGDVRMEDESYFAEQSLENMYKVIFRSAVGTLGFKDAGLIGKFDIWEHTPDDVMLIMLDTMVCTVPNQLQSSIDGANAKCAAAVPKCNRLTHDALKALDKRVDCAEWPMLWNENRPGWFSVGDGVYCGKSHDVRMSPEEDTEMLKGWIYDHRETNELKWMATIRIPRGTTMGGLLSEIEAAVGYKVRRMERYDASPKGGSMAFGRRD